MDFFFQYPALVSCKIKMSSEDSQTAQAAALQEGYVTGNCSVLLSHNHSYHQVPWRSHTSPRSFRQSLRFHREVSSSPSLAFLPLTFHFLLSQSSFFLTPRWSIMIFLTLEQYGHIDAAMLDWERAVLCKKICRFLPNFFQNWWETYGLQGLEGFFDDEQKLMITYTEKVIFVSISFP